MRVYFIGAHSTGKTTLARYVAEKHRLPFLNEVARTILAEKELGVDALRTNLKMVDDYQDTIFRRQIEEEKKHHSFVSDRSFDFFWLMPRSILEHLVKQLKVKKWKII